MTTTRRGSVTRRLLGALGGALLLMTALAGPALAQTSPPTTTPSTTTTTSSSTSGSAGASGTSGATTTSTGDATACAQLASQLTGLLGQIADLSTQLNALPVLSPLIEPLTAQIEALNEQADAVAQDLADAFCSLIPSGGGTEPDSETIFPTTDYPVRYFNDDTSPYSAYGGRYSSEPSEVVATQVASVPSGGVDTGDGTFGP